MLDTPVLALLIGAAILGIVVAYNRLVRLRNDWRNAFAQIDVQLKRRHDLIPNLVETVRGYMAHERDTLEAVVQARNASETARQKAAADPQPQTIADVNAAEGLLARHLGQLRVLVEAYPEIKADANARQLAEEIASTENRIAFARQAFNDAVTTYNSTRESVPINLVAALTGFQAATLLEATRSEAEREVPRVRF